MRTIRLVQITMIIQLALSALPGPVAATPSLDLIGQLDDWLDANTELPRVDNAPAIRITDPSQIPSPGGTAMAIGRHTRGLYDQDTSTIYLVRPWDAKNPHHVSVLVHEMVHHRQSGRHYYCAASQEYEAYKLQKIWLAQNGYSLDVNWIGVILASSCTPRDIHPD